MAKPLDALDYLAQSEKHAPRPICVLFGDESFLKREVLANLRRRVLSGDEDDFSLTTFDGEEVALREVMDELSTVAMFGGQRLVVVESGDDFVSRHRSELEDYAAHPRETATLVLQVDSWPATTRLYKALAESGLQIECKTPAPARLQKWLISWAKERHQAKLDPAAAEELAESVEPELGLLEQELAKLALMVGDDRTITIDMVRTAVGAWRTKTTWEMLDAAVDGDAGKALAQLDRLLLAGEQPVAILGQIGSSLRRFAAAARLVEEAETKGGRISLRDALTEAGFKPFVIGKAEPQLRQLGRVRAGRLYHWLLEADLALKGGSSSPARARFTLERLVARLSKRAAPAPAAVARR
jgi:DNA polymerase-3 subunit delta